MAVVSESVDGPDPLAALASYTLTAVGAVAPAGSVSGYVTTFVGSEQLPEAAAAEPAVNLVAVVGSVLPLVFVNVVEVAWMFHPVPLLVRSLGVSEATAVVVWSTPFNVTFGNASEDGDDSVSEPPLHGSLKVAMAAAHVPVFELVSSSLTEPLPTPLR